VLARPRPSLPFREHRFSPFWTTSQLTNLLVAGACPCPQKASGASALEPGRFFVIFQQSPTSVSRSASGARTFPPLVDTFLAPSFVPQISPLRSGICKYRQLRAIVTLPCWAFVENPLCPLPPLWYKRRLAEARYPMQIHCRGHAPFPTSRHTLGGPQIFLFWITSSEDLSFLFLRIRCGCFFFFSLSFE